MINLLNNLILILTIYFLFKIVIGHIILIHIYFFDAFDRYNPRIVSFLFPYCVITILIIHTLKNVFKRDNGKDNGEENGKENESIHTNFNWWEDWD